jgi:hypothetical protein
VTSRTIRMIAMLGSMTAGLIFPDKSIVAQSPGSPDQERKLAAEAEKAGSPKAREATSALPTGRGVDAKTMKALQVEKKSDEFLYSISSGVPGFSRIVRSKPFSAQAVTETIHVLEDGNQIANRNLMKEYRDAEGRTRREQTIEAIGPSLPVAPRQMIFIFDPVKGVNYISDPRDKVTHQFSIAKAIGSGDTESFHAALNEASKDAQVEDLGDRFIEGVECVGTRRTTSIPIGQIGNKAPVVIVSETWFSADIDAVIESTTKDPRYGTTHYWLREVQRREPSPALFEPPPHYKTVVTP